MNRKKFEEDFMRFKIVQRKRRIKQAQANARRSDDLTDPTNPLSPLNPANPASPLSPANPINQPDCTQPSPSVDTSSPSCPSPDFSSSSSFDSGGSSF